MRIPAFSKRRVERQTAVNNAETVQKEGRKGQGIGLVNVDHNLSSASILFGAGCVSRRRRKSLTSIEIRGFSKKKINVAFPDIPSKPDLAGIDPQIHFHSSTPNPRSTTNKSNNFAEKWCL